MPHDFRFGISGYNEWDGGKERTERGQTHRNSCDATYVSMTSLTVVSTGAWDVLGLRGGEWMLPGPPRPVENTCKTIIDRRPIQTLSIGKKIKSNNGARRG